MASHDILARAAPAEFKQGLGPIVLAADAAFAVPLATALRSIAENNTRAWPLDFHIIFEGITEATKRRVFDSLPKNSAFIKWHPIDTLTFASSYSTRPGISKMTYARLVLPRFLPANCNRALYLDADILAFDDLERLWNIDLGDAIVGAVPDYCLDPVANSERNATSRPRNERYFNAGMLLIDLAKWRSERLSERALEYLDCFPDAEYSDQDALNFVCEGKWKVLEKKWNFQFEPWQTIADTVVERKPAIVHFVTFVKPWRSGSLSPNVAFYDTFRSRTCFALTRRGRLQSALRRAGSRLLARSALLRTAWSWTKSTVQTHGLASARIKRKARNA